MSISTFVSKTGGTFCVWIIAQAPDRFATTFDHEGLVANAGLILAGTLMDRLGLSALIERWVRTGSGEPGPQDSAPWSPRCSQAAPTSITSRCCAPDAPGGCWGRPDGAVDGGVVPADVHVRSRPPARSGAVAHARSRMAVGSRPGPCAAGGRSGLHDLRGPRQTKTRRRVRLHQRARLEPLWLCWRLIGLVFQPRLGWSCGQRRTLLRILRAGCRRSGRGAVAG